VGFDVTDQLRIRFSAFVRYWRKNGSTMRQYISYSWTLSERTILTERPPLVGEVSANFC
jgi:hypothetical protein